MIRIYRTTALNSANDVQDTNGQLKLGLVNHTLGNLLAIANYLDHLPSKLPCIEQIN